MTDNHRGLALRRHSIRTLTAPELRQANAGAGASGTGNNPPTSGPTDRTISSATRTK